ncbi:MAG: radical SAM protein [Oscillospiraceae bacterium]|nr:radical SAM protein [Oscillospiraceae bacterium]
MKHANIAVFVPHVGCPNQCSFCNQKTISGQQSAPTGEDAAAICKAALTHCKRDAEIAFFGGSFTAIPRDYMLELLQAVQPFIGEGKFRGIRISTRPDAINEEILQLLQRYHVTSIELGVQSMDDEILRKNRRGHTAAHVKQAVVLIRNYPFELGLQFMPGLCGDTEESIRETAETIADLQPDTVRIYPTLVLQGTELADWYKTGRYEPLTLEKAVELCADLLLFFEERQIRVIRVGLHASEGMEGQLLAGPYHPAFRELCESRIFYRNALAQLQNKEKTKAYHLFTAPAALSKMNGQNGENLRKLRERGWNIKIKPDSACSGREIIIREFTKERKRRDSEEYAVKSIADPGL